MSIGSRIKERRESLGLTQIQLADALGITKGAVGNYETDSNSPKASTLYKVFEVLKCDANYLFQDEIRERREYTASPPEMDFIKKYRTLDEYGKEAVDLVLDVEFRRVRSNNSSTIVDFAARAKNGDHLHISVTGTEEQALNNELTDLPDADL